MKNILKAMIPVFLAVLLTSCNGFMAEPTTISTNTVEQATSLLPVETPFPTVFNTAVYTSIPTSTITPTAPPAVATVMTEPVPFTSFRSMFLIGVDRTGGNIPGYPADPFHLFAVQPGEIASFRFTMEIRTFHFIKNEHTPTPTAIPTSSWRLLIYRYRTDNTHIDQPVVETDFATVVTSYPDGLVNTLSADVTMRELQAKFGDCSAFTFQVIGEQGKTLQQGYFSINPHYLFFYEGGIKGNFKNGLTVGYPYSLNENEMEFFRQGKFVAVYEPQSGFYRLSYVFDFVHASGVSATSEQEKVASELSLRLFPYRDDGKYSVYDSHPAIAILHSTAGYLLVDLPIDYLQENVNGDDKYYLQIMDGQGKIIKDEYFMFVPYKP